MEIYEIFFLTLGFSLLMIYWVWIASVRLKNFSIFEAAWFWLFMAQGLFICYFTEGYWLRKSIGCLLLAVWSFKPAYRTTKLIRKMHPEESSLYLTLRAEFVADYENKFLLFFMYRSIQVSILMFPVIFVFKNQIESLSLLEGLGFLTAVLLISAEFWVSFKQKYFIEMSEWFGLYLFWLGTPHMAWAVYAPLMMGVLIYRRLLETKQI